MRIQLVSVIAVLAIVARPELSTAQTVRQIDANIVARICPGMGMSELTPGLPESAQNRQFIKTINRLPSEFAPFTEADLEMTSWSGRLAGITYIGASPDGDTNRAWAEALEESLLKAGWIRSKRTDLASPLTFVAQYFERNVDTSDGTRTILLEFDTPGAVMLRCGDLRLFEIQQNESQGILESGSKRPFEPRVEGKPLQLPVDSDCDDPVLLNAFRDLQNVDESSEAFQKFAMSGDASLSTQARFRQRLVTWLKWKLLNSGKVDQDRLWQLQDKAAVDQGKDVWFLTEKMLVAMGKAAEATKEENDTGRAAEMCRFFVAIIGAEHARNQRDIIYNAKVAKILESEARRLDINVSD